LLDDPISVGLAQEQSFIVAAAVVDAEYLDVLFGNRESNRHATTKPDKPQPRTQIIPGHSNEGEIRQTVAIVDERGSEALCPVEVTGYVSDPEVKVG